MITDKAFSNFCSSLFRLTSLFEETRQFINLNAKSTEHGHNCSLVVLANLSKFKLGSDTPLFSHGLEQTFLLDESR